MDGKVFGDQPLISVVMCTYNARQYIEEAVGCILRQTYTNWEMIISDDCSTDGTREYLEHLGDNRIRLFLQSKNLGYVANKNFVHQQTTGTYITQMDNDDVCVLDRLEKQVAVIQQRPEIRIVGCGYRRIDDKSVETGYTTSGQDELIRRKGEKEYPFWFPSLLIHRSVFAEIGFFEPYFAGAYGDDIYWTVKANEKYPIWCLKDVLYSYRINPTSITNTLNSPRKLIMGAVLSELFRQRQERGTDWIEEGNLKAVIEYEKELLHNRKYMGEQYRIWAAKSIDKQDFKSAKGYLTKSIQLNWLNPDLLRTTRYFIYQKYIK